MSLLVLFSRILLFIILIISPVYAGDLENCNWDNKNGVPCLIISKTNNTSSISAEGVSKTVLTKQDIKNSGHVNLIDILKNISGLDAFQSGHIGQSSSVFTRGSESNHTLVLLNGIAINDSSVTDGMHDFGQDFVQSIQQIEIYKGSALACPFSS